MGGKIEYNEKPNEIWYPKEYSDLNLLGRHILVPGLDVEITEHPAFHDPKYVERKRYFIDVANSYHVGDATIPKVDYYDSEL